MSYIVNAADTIFEHPAYNDFNDGVTPVVQGGRLMSSGPHLDGLIWIPAESLAKNSANLVLTRNAKGDWSLNRTAAGAETYYVRGVPTGIVTRTGEKYNLDSNLVGPAAPAKGVAIRDMFVVLNVGVALLTSATLRLGSTQYEAPAASLADTGAAIVQTDIVAATSVNPSALTTASDYVTQKVTNSANPSFVVTDITQLEIELAAVMANTGTIQIAGVGAHVNFLFN